MKRKIAFILMLALYVTFYVTSYPIYLILLFAGAVLYFLISIIFYHGAF